MLDKCGPECCGIDDNLISHTVAAILWTSETEGVKPDRGAAVDAFLEEYVTNAMAGGMMCPMHAQLSVLAFKVEWG